MGLVVLFLAGCRKEEKAPEIPASSPASYMNDPVFRREVADKRKELQAIVNERNPLVKRMEALIKEHGQDLASLQKIPEWNELYKKVTALNKKYEEVRTRQLKVVRERISPGSKRSGDRFPDTKRSGDRFPVQCGEAVSRPLQDQKDISK